MASIVDTSVKHAYSSMTGALVINGTAGSLIATLDAFLVSGWGAKSVDSAVISNGVCRLTFASGKSAAEPHTVIQVSGATPGGLNGEQRVTAVATGWVEFKTDLPDGAVSGSVNFKMASLGWEKVYSGTNKAVYRSTDASGSRPYLRVDDGNALYARVQMYESMTDIDTGLAVAPQTVSGGYYWHKSNVVTTARYWALVGDSRGFYLALAPYSTSTPTSEGSQGMVHSYFGDAKSYRSGDAWCAVLTGNTGSSYSDVFGCVFQASGSTGISVQRLSFGMGIAAQSFRLISGATPVGISGLTSMAGTFPSRVDNGLHLTDIMVTDGSDYSPRGRFPGALYALQSNVLAGFGADVRLTAGQGIFAGKQLLSMACGTPSNTSNVGVAFYNITDPWRE